MDQPFGDYLEDWLERRRTILRPATYHSYRQLLRCYLLSRLGHLPLGAIDRRTLERCYAELLAAGGRRGRPLAPKTVRYCHAIVRRALEDALVDGLIDDNPARQARPPRHDPAMQDADEDLQVWTGEQAVRFLAFVDDHPWRALWHVALGTGARRSELLGLRWSDVDLAVQQIRIRRALTVVDGVPRLLGTKTSRSRTLSIGGSVVAALDRWRREQQERQRVQAPVWRDRWGLVFTTEEGDHLDPMQLTVTFRDLVRRAPVPVIRLHDVRHTHATLLLSVGTPVKVVSERLGHTTIAMTMDVYGHVLPAMDADAADRLDGLLAGRSADTA